ncbi:MAG: exodeoxyribonuclease V subunit gamma [Planctomycetes bacterium]|nr:exodeoxyribonuclease V subunit gamma [Planctomycetota bacterium]
MTPGIVLHTSYRLEDLAASLAHALRTAPLAPLDTETIVVPTQGLARWLELQLAEAHGIAAGLRFPFPGAFLGGLSGAARRLAADPFARDVLHLRLFRLLGDPALAGQLGPAAGYCEGDPDGRKRFQLAAHLAAAFDDYQLYRGDLLAAAGRGADLADQGPHGPWQAALWRALLRDAGLTAPEPDKGKRRRARRDEHTPLLFPELAEESAPVGDGQAAAHRLDALRDLLADPERARACLPPRVAVFGAVSLPPAFLEMLQRIAAHVPVHLFVPQPTPHYFGDVRPRQHEGANALLGRFGTLAREFADQLLELEEHASVPFTRNDLAPPPDPEEPAPSLLACVQRDIAAVFDRGDAGARWALRTDDASLRVHDCHSPQRELEVVRDQILAAFAEDPSLEPHEVLVLVPDITVYAPYAEAVFGPVQEHLPFQVADRDPASELPLCASLLAVLELAMDRLMVFDVLHLCELPALLRRFRLFANELPTLRHWCERASIRWGQDGEARARQFKMPAFEENSWRQGLERLLIGAATGPLDTLVLGRLPAADATSGRDDLLQRFLNFVDTLFDHLPRLQRNHPPNAWADLLDALLAALYAPDSAEDEQASQRLQRATADLRSLAEQARVDEPWSPIVLRDWLRQNLRQSAAGRGFLTGRVTVAAMQPMRTVPVRHLFLCGMSDQGFPRRDQPQPFDLMARQRRPGDRSVRLDDRQLFLEALLAARERLHICFVGRSQKDDSPCAPSVVLAELLDHVDRTCDSPDAQPPRDHVLVRHPLQSWSHRYRTGDDPRLFTYARAAGAPAHHELVDEPPFAAAPVTPPAELLQHELPFDRLLEFWKHPCRFYLQHVLRLRVRRDDDDDLDTEPFAVDHLDRWRLQDSAVRAAQRGDPPPRDPLAAARATGLLPVGGHGVFAFADVDAETEAFLLRVDGLDMGRRRTVRVQVGAVTLHGDLDGLAADFAVAARIAKLKPKDRLRGWLRHLLLAAARGQGRTELPARSLILAKDYTLHLPELDPPRALAHLEVLLAGYRQGAHAPLPFFEKSSYEYAERLHDNDDAATALRAARKKWLPDTSDFPTSDSEDEAVALAMRGHDALQLDGFARWAEAIWGPFLPLAKEDPA